MKAATSMLCILIGTAFGVGMTLSCSDNSPGHSDAATCDCAAGEPPIAERVVAFESTSTPIEPGEQSLVSTICPLGMQFLSGSCTSNLEILEDITLQQAGFVEKSLAWGCIFKNNKATAVMVKASVLCLKPAL